MQAHEFVNLGDIVKWLQFLVGPLLLEQWGLEAQGEIWFQGLPLSTSSCRAFPALRPSDLPGHPEAAQMRRKLLQTGLCPECLLPVKASTPKPWGASTLTGGVPSSKSL